MGFVLLDFNLGPVSGPEAIPALRALRGGENLPIIMYTNSEALSDIEKSYLAGADHYLVKPIGLQRNRAILEKLHTCATRRPPCYDGLAELRKHQCSLSFATILALSWRPRCCVLPRLFCFT
jgi:DNA-binding response OmpR family regulator